MWKFAVLVVALLATPAMGQIAGTISVYTNRGDLVRNGNFKRWVREFEAIYPGTSVRVTLVERYGEEMAERFEKRSYGDVILVPTDMPKEAYPKFFLPLNDTGLSSKVYFANSWAYKEQEYAYTQGVSAEGLIYNKRVLGLAGETEPPLTVDQLYTLCEKIKANGKTPIFLNVGAGWPLQQWDKAVMQLSENGNYYESMLTQAAPFSAGQPYETSLGIVNKLFKSGYSEPDFIHDQWQSSKVAFAANEGGLFFLGSWAIPQLIEAGIASRDIGFVPFPVDNTEQAKGILNFDWGIAISRFSKNPQTAKAWLKFFLVTVRFCRCFRFYSHRKISSTRVGAAL
jgi:ABC-type sugar transport system, periplasmic component